VSVVGHRFGRRHAGHAGLVERRGVGHGAHNALVTVQALLDALDGHAGGHGNDQGIGIDGVGDRGQHLVHDLRFDRHHKHISPARRFGIVVMHAHAQFLGQGLALLLAGVGRVDGFGVHAAGDQAADQRPTHVAAADEGNRDVFHGRYCNDVRSPAP